MQTENKPSTPGRFYYMDLLRIAATVAVIVIHVTAEDWHLVDVRTGTWAILTAYNSISQWAVAIFVMISGALFLGRQKPLGEIYKKNVLRLAAAYVFWAVCYALVEYLQTRKLRSALITLLYGSAHLWFLLMIIGLYILVPFLQRIAQEEKLLQYFLLLSFLFAILLPNAITVVTLLHDGAGKLLQTVYDKIHMFFVLGYSFYFLLGYYLHTKELSARAYRRILVLGILGLLITFFSTFWLGRHTGKANEQFIDNLCVSRVLESVFLFLFARRRFGKKVFSPRAQKIIAALSKYSFGVYLVHFMVIRILRVTLHVTSLSFNPLLSVPVMTCIVAVCSLGISALLHRIPFLNKYIV